MSSRRSIVFAVIALAGPAAVLGASRPPAESRSQLAFGVQMAQRGLWSEAVFRFNAARQLAPEDPKVLNNLAVACEAMGRFDEALEAYRAALKVDPGNRQLKQNYARFVEFYQSFRPAAPKGGTAPGASPDKTTASQPTAAAPAAPASPPNPPEAQAPPEPAPPPAP